MEFTTQNMDWAIHELQKAADRYTALMDAAHTMNNDGLLELGTCLTVVDAYLAKRKPLEEAQNLLDRYRKALNNQMVRDRPSYRPNPFLDKNKHYPDEFNLEEIERAYKLALECVPDGL